MRSLKVTVTVRKYPTESEEKIVEILRDLFPGMEIEQRGDYIVGRGGGESLETLLDMIKRERIAARAYALFKKRRRGDTIVIPLERDPLVVKRLSFGEDGEFPPIWVEIRGDVDEVLARLRDIADTG
ncbi:TPA: hypothetical protein EYP13_00405 [Candidatus Micrarchaeota archaeon]|nr:hypothetical protein [Candidatus Micrarchaeota archaeon]